MLWLQNAAARKENTSQTRTGGHVKEGMNGGQKAEGEKGEERGKATVTVPDNLACF